MKMASLLKYLNRTRDTICKNCISFSSVENNSYDTDMCTYYDIPTNAEDNFYCREYSEPGDDEENIPLEILKKGGF